jgi:hypothetical protein
LAMPTAPERLLAKFRAVYGGVGTPMSTMCWGRGSG